MSKLLKYVFLWLILTILSILSIVGIFLVFFWVITGEIPNIFSSEVAVRAFLLLFIAASILWGVLLTVKYKGLWERYERV